MGHVPVLLDETVAALRVRRGGRYVDGTLGRAGHARAVAAAGGEVLGIDRDGQALAEVESMKAAWPEGAAIHAVKGNHGEIGRLAAEFGWESVDGVLLDLGVSSPQLDEASRGFSFLHDGPLDMRMDRTCGASAAEIVNGESAERLEEIFREYGEEPQARRIARAVAGRRGFATTGELAEFVERTVGRRGARHPATRVFQALRMAVNDEMGELERALEAGMELLAPGGRFAVITFESLTDRTVKRFFAEHVGRMRALQQGGEEWAGARPRARAVTRKPIVADERETNSNPRSRSAKLRVVERE